MWLRHRVTRQAIAALSIALFATSPTKAEPPAFGGWQCVPFARQMSGIQIYGDAWTWWDQASGRYASGFRPKRGAVLVFKPSGVMKSGHVAVVSKVIAQKHHHGHPRQLVADQRYARPERAGRHRRRYLVRVATGAR